MQLGLLRPLVSGGETQVGVKDQTHNFQHLGDTRHKLELFSHTVAKYHDHSAKPADQTWKKTAWQLHSRNNS